MPRTRNEELLSLVFNRCESQSTVDIRLLIGPPKFFSTNVRLDLDETYIPRILKVGVVKETGTPATNRVQVVLSNTDLEWGIKLASELRDLELADVVVKRLFRSLTDASIFQHKHFFSGKVVNVEADEQQIVFDIVPKSTAAGSSLSIRTLSALCAWIFKDHNCQYFGLETFCNLVRKSRGGCRGRLNEPNNGGFAFPENPTQSAPGSGGNPATGVGAGHCFFEGEPILTARGTQPVETIKKFWRVWNFNPATMAVESDTVSETFVNFVSEYFEFVFSDNSKIRTTSEEPFFDEAGNFIPAHALRFDSAPTVVWRFVGGDWRKASLKSAKRFSGEVWKVYNFETLRNKTLFANGFAFHNKEQDPGVLT
ncbi:MAG TPA: hypothetical protein VGC76_14485 [Pyrinomonadaceae bacterium]|jgi:hypothetical protein